MEAVVVSPTPCMRLALLAPLALITPVCRRVWAKHPGAPTQPSDQNYDPRVHETTRLKRNRSTLNHLLPAKSHNSFIISTSTHTGNCGFSWWVTKKRTTQEVVVAITTTTTTTTIEDDGDDRPAGAVTNMGYALVGVLGSHGPPPVGDQAGESP